MTGIETKMSFRVGENELVVETRNKQTDAVLNTFPVSDKAMAYKLADKLKALADITFAEAGK